ncbi:MAG TPA: ABC transporter permease [Gemmatimonadaceae bacterium]|nr:ABC transporter permease [Gemmatimonadaceae bacterium]
MRALSTHLHFVLRTLRRAPAFTAISVLCLAVGIGAITTMVEVVDLLLFRPPPHVRAPKEVVQLRFDFVFPGRPHPAKQAISNGVVYSHYLALRDSLPELAGVAGYHTAELSLERGDAARPVTAGFVTGNFFTLLGVRAEVGHLFDSDDARANGGAPPAVISHALWKSHFAGDSSVIGRTVTVGKELYTIAAIAPEGFRGVETLKPMDLWLPIGAAEQELYGGRHEEFFAMSEGLVQVLARLRPDIAPELVTAKAAAIVQHQYLAVFGPRFADTRTVASASALVPGLHGERSTDISVALWLTGVAAIVLLIACANVAGLLLVRAADRQREVAIRLALGATRAQLAQLFLVEGLILALAGGVLGIALRQWGGSIIRAFLLPQLGILHGTLDVRVLGISALVTVATGLMCGLVPALHASRRDIAGAVIGAPRPGRAPRPYVRSALLVGQVALAMALVAGAALFITSWWNVRAIRLGFAPDQLIVGRMPLPDMGYSTAESRGIYQEMAERVRALPGVSEVSVASSAPFVSTQDAPVTIPGVDRTKMSKAMTGPVGPELYVVSPSFFATAGTQILRGRGFTDVDHAGAPAVTIINESFAKAFWPAGDAIGKCVQIRSWGPPSGDVPCSEIVGIAADVKSESIRGEPGPQMYAPLAQRSDVAPGELLVRTDGDPSAILPSVRHAMLGAASGLPFAEAKLMPEYLEPEMRPWRLGASMFTLFGAVALGLAAVGLYGVFSYAVSRRTREMGIRTALGARCQDIIRLVMLDGISLAVAGMLIGVILAFAIGKVLGALLVGVSGASPALLGAAGALVICVALLAVALPARRAASVDPAVALREE